MPDFAFLLTISSLERHGWGYLVLGNMPTIRPYIKIIQTTCHLIFSILQYFDFYSGFTFIKSKTQMTDYETITAT
jgi:hypothetical protein